MDNKDDDDDQPDSHIVDVALGRATRTASSIRAAGDRARELVRNSAGEAREQGERYTDAAVRQLRVAQLQVSNKVQEKPIVTTLVVLGAALLLGAILAGRNSTVRRSADRLRRRF